MTLSPVIELEHREPGIADVGDFLAVPLEVCADPFLACVVCDRGQCELAFQVRGRACVRRWAVHKLCAGEMAAPVRIS